MLIHLGLHLRPEFAQLLRQLLLRIKLLHVGGGLRRVGQRGAAAAAASQLLLRTYAARRLLRRLQAQAAWRQGQLEWIRTCRWRQQPGCQRQTRVAARRHSIVAYIQLAHQGPQ